MAFAGRPRRLNPADIAADIDLGAREAARNWSLVCFNSCTRSCTRASSSLLILRRASSALLRWATSSFKSLFAVASAQVVWYKSTNTRTFDLRMSGLSGFVR